MGEVAKSATYEPPLVDTHFHVYTRDMPLQATAWHRPASDASIEQAMETLDANGVLFGVIAAASLYGDYNDYTLTALREHKRLRATAIIDPSTDVRVMRKMQAEGFIGVRFQWRDRAEAQDLTAPHYQRLLHHMADIGWIAHVHDNGPRLPPAIAAIEAAGVRLVVEHFGRPKGGVDCPGFRATLDAVERGRTWVKLSAGFRLEPPSAALACAKALLNVSGGDRLLWGSDWPFAAFEGKVQYADTIAALNEWVPDLVARRKITRDTPIRLFFS
jgi:predicted TIM-barrel fold metal-dependent hydrolase